MGRGVREARGGEDKGAGRGRGGGGSLGIGGGGDKLRAREGRRKRGGVS